MEKIFEAIIVATFLCVTTYGDGKICTQTSACVCEFSEYSKLDLTNATQYDGPLQPQDFLKDTDGNVTYYFHGCTDGEFNATTGNSSHIYKASLVIRTGVNVIDLTSEQIAFSVGEDQESYQMLYKYQNGTIGATIDLMCSHVKQPFIKKLIHPDSNSLVFGSPHACIQTRSHGLSTGSVLVIIFLLSIVIYLMCGSALLYFIRGARGLEIIPNIDFWKELPGLVKDGTIFIFTGCSANAINTAETYDKI